MNSRNSAPVTWLFILSALLMFVVLDVPGRLLVQWAHAVERGRIQADSEELARVEEVSHTFRLVSRVAQAGVVNIEVRPSGADTAEFERLGEKILKLRAELDELQSSFDVEHADPGRDEALLLLEKIRTRHREVEAIEKRRALLRATLMESSGSGIIYDADGHVLTNNHVIDGNREVRVRLPDEREYIAALVGADPETDLALLKIAASDLHPLQFGDSDAVEVGDWVLAVGAPFGLTHSVTHGIISARGRTNINTGDRQIVYQDFLQTDAAINPGNSGGPLLNMRGEVIGVNTAIATNGDSYNAGIAFTIPSNTAVKIADRLKTSGDVERGWLGVSMGDLGQDDRQIFGADDGGVMVAAVIAGTPAQRAGLRVEDIVVAVNGAPVRTRDEMLAVIADIFPGEQAEIELIRNRNPIRRSVKLGRRPDDMRAARASGAPDEAIALVGFGLQARTLRPLFARQLGFSSDDRGALVVLTEAGTTGGDAGIEPGELVVRCDGRAITTAAGLAEQLAHVTSGASVSLTLLAADGKRRDVELKRQ